MIARALILTDQGLNGDSEGADWAFEQMDGRLNGLPPAPAALLSLPLTVPLSLIAGTPTTEWSPVDSYRPAWSRAVPPSSLCAFAAAAVPASQHHTSDEPQPYASKLQVNCQDCNLNKVQLALAIVLAIRRLEESNVRSARLQLSPSISTRIESPIHCRDSQPCRYPSRHLTRPHTQTTTLPSVDACSPLPRL